MLKLNRIKLSTLQIIALGFIIIILVGAGLLSLPFASVDGGVSFIDALFTATSATCVTGLVAVSYTHLTLPTKA